MRCCVLFLLLCLFSQIAETDSTSLSVPFKLAFGENSVPWSWMENGQPTGLLVEIANEALVVRMKVNVEFQFYPWIRAQENIKRGFSDALITNFDGDRKKYTTASNELITNFKRMIFVNINDPLISEILKVQSLSDLRTYSIGSSIGVTWTKSTFHDYNIEVAGSVKQALKMLEGSRFNVYIANPIATQYKLKTLKLKNIIMLPNVLSDVKESRYKLLIGNHSNFLHLIPEFDKTIQAMKADGTLKKIFDSYK